ncbi:major facilitator superfamily domain-containing protein [Xylogone sp. PMI_703]|nr:major facilitator superfamily domain-containing protein [Xylogone sp. PMI_703]
MATLEIEKDLPSAVHDPDINAHGSDKSDAASVLKLDQHGLPLVPQPSDHKDDPLNWSKWYKYYVLTLLCLLAFVVQFGAGMITPALAEIAKRYDTSIQRMSYMITSYILFTGVIPLLITPFVNIYGRRPAYLIFTLIGIAGNIGSGYAPTYATQIVCRCVVGIGSSVALAIGGATICDMFFQGERGYFIGIYALALTNGPHLGPIPGGYIALRLGYQWIFFVQAIMMASLLVVFAVSFPESLFSRTEFSNLEGRSYWQRMTFQGKIVNHSLRLSNFLHNFRMLKYWSITLTCIYYMMANTFGSLLFTLTMTSICKELYGYNTAQTGLLLGIPQTVGCLIGESCTGWISDWLINRYASRHDGYRKPEVRLYLAPLGLFLPIGLIIHGVCVQHRAPWIALAIAMVVTSFGVQAGTTITYSYCSDCYKPQAAEVSTIINLFRFVFAFTLGFYILPFAERNGFDVAWGTIAAIQFASWLLLLLLIWKGEKIRQAQGTPNLHEDL